MKKKIFISAANLFSGGTLSILEDCLTYANAHLSADYDITALVYKKELFNGLNHIALMEFPAMRKSYFHRLYMEYLHYNGLGKENEIFLWLSLNDMSSRVQAKRKAVYFHNPSPFRKPTVKDLIGQPRWFFFTLFYKFLYQFNVSSNDYIIVQQDWLRTAFVKMFNLDRKKVIVAAPTIAENNIAYQDNETESLTPQFFYPTFPRPFKNIEVLCKAVDYISNHFNIDFKVTITIDGTENRYSKQIVDQYKNNSKLNFIGLISRNEVFDYYAKSSCLLFPSKLETWGLPISEFKNYNKPILLADLPYAHETLGDYAQGSFFDADDEISLAKLMVSVMKGEHVFVNHVYTKPMEPTSNSWESLFKILLK